MLVLQYQLNHRRRVLRWDGRRPTIGHYCKRWTSIPSYIWYDVRFFEFERRASEFLEFDLEEPHTPSVGAAAISRDHQFVHARGPLTAHQFQPAPDRINENCAVSLSGPTLTQPALAAIS